MIDLDVWIWPQLCQISQFLDRFICPKEHGLKSHKSSTDSNELLHSSRAWILTEIRAFWCQLSDWFTGFFCKSRARAIGPIAPPQRPQRLPWSAPQGPGGLWMVPYWHGCALRRLEAVNGPETCLFVPLPAHSPGRLAQTDWERENLVKVVK